jgi:basic amino acid/polyamine antiporter, APA family
MKIARFTGLALSALLIIVGFLHQYSVGFEADKDRTLLYISIAFAVIHFVVFGRKMGRVESED